MAIRNLKKDELQRLRDIRWFLTGYRAAGGFDMTPEHIDIIDETIEKGQVNENGRSNERDS
jgi:hypothetical protein